MKKTVVLALLLVPVLWACAQGAMKDSSTVVAARAVPAQVEAAAGERLYAHEDTMFIGVDLVPAKDFPLRDFQAAYPVGHEGEFFGEKVVTISGKEAITGSALVPAELAAGEHTLNLAVTVQACDDKTCLAPADLPVKLKLTVK